MLQKQLKEVEKKREVNAILCPSLNPSRQGREAINPHRLSKIPSIRGLERFVGGDLDGNNSFIKRLCLDFLNYQFFLLQKYHFLPGSVPTNIGREGMSPGFDAAFVFHEIF